MFRLENIGIKSKQIQRTGFLAKQWFRAGPAAFSFLPCLFPSCRVWYRPLKEIIMPLLRTACSTCGTAIEITVVEPFSGAALVRLLCRACTDRQFLDQEGAVLMLTQELDGARFPLGKITITPGAVEALAEAGEHVASFLQRHVQGDWGESGKCDQIELSADEQRRGWEATEDAALAGADLVK